jgi:hypothetical protein
MLAAAAAEEGVARIPCYCVAGAYRAPSALSQRLMDESNATSHLFFLKWQDNCAPID